jgi:hypothetical protein
LHVVPVLEWKILKFITMKSLKSFENYSAEMNTFAENLLENKLIAEKKQNKLILCKNII